MIVSVIERSLVAEVRRRSVELASAQGLDETDAGRAAIVATELASNLLKHAGGGDVAITPFDDVDGKGIELLALDKGPGIPDLQKSLTDGHSTAGTAGSGLGSIQRNSDVFAISSQVGRGTAVLARLRPRNQAGSRGYTVSNVSAPYPGEALSGDGWSVKSVGNRLLLLMADGSGHGALAHAAAVRASEIFTDRADAPLEQIAHSIHRGLGATRGAAIAVADIDPQRRQVDFVGVGNISAALIENGTVRRMVSHNGTAGHVAPRIHSFQYPFRDEATVILHSDGLTARWDLGLYPGLIAAHPSLISGVLYRDYRRGKDDATVVAVRNNSIWPAS
jgi:anti-sigma regulatory factor (Ser/Thr protein kinase)